MDSYSIPTVFLQYSYSILLIPTVFLQYSYSILLIPTVFLQYPIDSYSILQYPNSDHLEKSSLREAAERP